MTYFNIKVILLIPLCLFSFIGCSTPKEIDIKKHVLEQLEIGNGSYSESLLRSEKISPNRTLFVIPEIHTQSESQVDYNGYIVIVDNKGDIESIYFEEKMWTSDALYIEEIHISYNPYEISQNSETIGIHVHYSGSSGVNPYNTTELSLFLKNKNTFEKVLESLPVYRYAAETDGNQNAEIQKTSTQLSTIKQEKESGFYDIHAINEEITYSIYNEEFTILSENTSQSRLVYQNNNYTPISEK